METINDILREMRENKGTPVPFAPMNAVWVTDFHAYIDRIEAAHKRELADALNTGAFVEAARKREAADAKTETTTGNNAKMREALEYLRDASREFHHLILNSKHNEICDKYKYAEVAKISDAIANANVALAEPPRNCDVATEAEAIESLQRTMPRRGLSYDERNIVTACIRDIVRALYAPYKKGSAE